MKSAPKHHPSWITPAYWICAAALFLLSTTAVFASEVFATEVNVLGSVCILFLSAAILIRRKAHQLGCLLGTISGTPALISIWLQLFDTDRKATEWLSENFFSGVGLPKEIPLPAAAAISIAALGFGWLIYNRSVPRRPILLGSAGALVIAIGCAALIGENLQMPLIGSWGIGAPVSPQLAVAICLLGGALTFTGMGATRLAETRSDEWQPFAIITGGTVFSLIFWAALSGEQQSAKRETIALRADNLAAALHAELDARLRTLSRMATRHELTEKKAHAVRESEASQLVADMPGTQRIGWIFPDAAIEHIHPARKLGTPAHESATLWGPSALQSAIAQSRTTKAPAISDLFEDSITGSLTLFLCAPPQTRSDFFVVARTDASELLQLVIQRSGLKTGHLAAITLGGKDIFPPTELGARADIATHSYEIFSHNLTFKLSSTPLDERVFIDLPSLALCLGLLTTALGSLATKLGLRSARRRKLSELANQSLQKENQERRRAEVRLKRSEERLELALESTKAGIFDWHVAERRAYMSPSIWLMLGYEPSLMTQSMENWDTLAHPEDQHLLARIKPLTPTGAYHQAEYRVRTSKGQWLWVLERARCISFSTDGQPVRVLGTIQDNTEQRMTEEIVLDMQATARKLAIVASITESLVLICGPTGKIEWFNESFSRELGHSLDKIGDTSFTTLIAEETPLAAIGQIHASLASGQPFVGEIVMLGCKGQLYHLGLELQPDMDIDGNVQRYVAVMHDITSRIETERNLRLAKTQAEAATRAKSEFLASMSHEIRTPMNGVIALTRLLSESPLNAEQRDWVRTIQTSGDSLLTIINSILDFSKIESGYMEIERQPFSLHGCIEETLELFAHASGSKNVELGYAIDPSIADTITGDATRLRQVLVNLVGNAVKFTQHGAISVLVRAAPQPDTLYFEVTDSGIGIPEDRAEALFQPFSQVDSSITRKFGGTGLGLAISKRLVELMGGTIRLQSKIGSGTTFEFSINCSLTAATKTPAKETKFLRRRALIIDDNPVATALLTSILTEIGFNCSNATNLAEALAEKAQLDIAFIDFGLGANSPLETIAALRKHHGAKTPLPIVALALVGQAPSAEIIATHHIDAILPKPLRRHSVNARVSSLFSKDTSPQIPVPEQQPPAPNNLANTIPLSVLIVEDNPINRKVALRLVERIGYKADTATNGLEAVKAIEAKHYDLVFMDVQMPELDGIEATKRIRASLPKNRQPIIVALTANALMGEQRTYAEAGMNDTLTKPVSPEDISGAINRHFGKKSATANPPLTR